jgi:Flp pilus assembly protein TadB
MTGQPPRLASEDVIINAPMSYTGSAQRIMRLRRHGAALIVLALLLIVFAWLVVTLWYAVTVLLLGLITVPYRLLRRGARKRKAEALRHRELLDTIGDAEQPPGRNRGAV